MDSIPFLKDVARKIFETYSLGLEDVTIIFPNKRAGLFFRKYLTEHLEKPIWSPSVMSMEDFVLQYSDLRVADRVTLIVGLYKVYRKLIPTSEEFDKFYYWGEMLVEDFDDIDKFLINPKHLFTNLSRLKQLDSAYDYLTDEQRQVILSFWSNMNLSSSKSTDFQLLWDNIFKIYSYFVEQLKDEKRAYLGLLYRELVNNLSVIKSMDKLVFVGFNALTTSEERIFVHCVENGAEVYWDIDAYYLEDDRQEAGYFLRKYRKHTVLGKTFPKEIPDNISRCEQERKISLSCASLEVEQVQMLSNQLSVLLRSGLDMQKTAIVLPKEQLLIPLLNTIPSSIDSLNVTMGIPMRNSPLYGLLKSLIELQKSATEKGDNWYFYYKPLLQVIQHPLISQSFSNESKYWNKKIVKRNRSKVLIEGNDALCELVLFCVSDTRELIDYLKKVISHLYQENEKLKVTAIERQYAFHFYTKINQIQEVFSKEKIKLNIDVFYRLFDQIVNHISVPVSGEPLVGMQVMGMLETRNIDFDNVFILSMNEGSTPVSSNRHSFLPYNLRKGYGLPTYEEHDAMYSYLFYRLIQRAKRVNFYYTTDEEQGELSRYVRQLQHETMHDFITVSVFPNVLFPKDAPITINKDDKVLSLLEKYKINTDKSQKRLAPSALNTYLDCRLKFYFRYVAGIYESDTLQSEITPLVFGNILHYVMEILYQPYIGKSVTATEITIIKSTVQNALDIAFAKHYFFEEDEKITYEGEQLLIKDIILKYINKILKLDEEYAPFTILGLEEGEKYTLDISTSYGDIGLKGIIDRIDRKGDTVRVIDYKTGSDEKTFPTLESLFDRDDGKRNKAAMQTMLYALLFNNKNVHKNEITPAIFNTKKMHEKSFDYRLTIKESNSKIDNAIPYLNDFQHLLSEFINEIYDPDVPFDQTDEYEKCKYCPYVEICGRGNEIEN